MSLQVASKLLLIYDGGVVVVARLSTGTVLQGTMEPSGITCCTEY